MLETLRLESFTPLLGTRFQLRSTGEQPVGLELIAAEDHGSDRHRERFSLQFRGPLAHFLPQAIYPLRHPALGDFDLFLAPIRQEAEGFVYEAVFNRFRANAETGLPPGQAGG